MTSPVPWDRMFGHKKVKRIFIAATRQNVGKTTVSLGLIAALAKRFNGIAFIKPVGQRYLVEDGCKVDEDSILMDRIFNFNVPIQNMSPVAVEKGYTEKFLDGKITSSADLAIREAFDKVSSGKEVVIIEGTGHAGVGSVFDLSNAAVAKMLDSRVIMVSMGGIGNPIDEVMVNKSLFDKMGVKLAGVVVNKVLPHKYEKVAKYARLGLNRLDVPVLGVMPYAETLDMPSLRDIREELDMHVLCGEEYMGRQMGRVLVGAMEVREALHSLEDDCIVITPGNRGDLIGLLIKVQTGRFKSPKRIAGLILSGGIAPKRKMYNALKSAGIPTLLSRLEIYDVASRVHDLTVKIKYRDKNKVKLAIDMVEKYVDIETVCKNLG